MAHKGAIDLFAKHHVAANILMLLMIIAGVWGLSKLNTQFLPNFALDVITVNVVWPGATAEDVERSITIPLEQELKTIYNINEITSVSFEGRASVSIEFQENSDMGLALDDVKERVSLVRNLPLNAQEPEISRVVRFENIAQIILTGSESLEALRPVAYDIKRKLLRQGVAKIDIKGLPEQELAIQIPSETLFEIRKTLPEIAQEIDALSLNIPAGTAGKDELGHSIRSPEQLREIRDFESLPLSLTNEDEPVLLKELATLTQRPQKDEVIIRYKGKPAIQLNLLRTEDADSLKSAKILNNWVIQDRPTYGQNIDIHVYNESYKPIQERIDLLLKNGVGGLILILIILFILLDKRIAFWVAAGIPVSIFAALGLLYLFGGTINMVSLFALIMTLGIIVDDTIVVGENAFTRMQQGEHPLSAAINAAHSMFVPVMASSLTTIAAFLPLMLIGGVIGNILFDIPFVVICVISASIIECFFVLPGHLYHSFNRLSGKQISAEIHKESHTVFAERFVKWRETTYRHFITRCIEFRWVTLSIAVAIGIVILSLAISGRVGFTFFPTPDGQIVRTHIQFIAGTPEDKVNRFVDEVLAKLDETRNHFKALEGQDIVQHAVVFLKQGAEQQSASRGSYVASIIVELSSPDQRNVLNTDFVNQWRESVQLPAGIEKFTIFAQRGGPPGKDIDINIIAEDTSSLKAASLTLQEALNEYSGVFNVQDDLPYGKPQLVYRLTTQGESLGLTLESLGQQLRAAFDGNLFQIFNLVEEEVEVRVILPDDERDNLATLHYFPIKTPGGKMAPLNTVAYFSFQQGLESIRHTDGLLTTNISAEIDVAQTNANTIISDLEQTTLPDLMRTFGIEYQLKGRSEDQAETFADMGKGVVIALVLIYLILAWVFSSYLWPLAVMAILPFGIIGAIFGHWVMGLNLTLLSFFGFFGLSGIVVNDSIILVTAYRRLRQDNMKMQQAIVEASVTRLRAVLLTSLTTIAGLTPLVFETSLQAQFLIPMAVSISFGLMFATFLVLIIVPILLYSIEHAKVSAKWTFRSYKRNRLSPA